MSNDALIVEGITKRIGAKKIVDDVHFQVKKGEIFGLLGPNGAGKTTIIRMIVGLINRTSGKVHVNGYDLDADYNEVLNNIGAIVENPEFYGYMSGYKNLLHYARMSRQVISKERIAEVVRLVHLEDALKQKVKTYSLGMRQRLGVAQAILHSPAILILDEPTNGLDPKGMKEFRNYLRELANQGTSVLVSSHLLSEMQLMCDRFAIIEKGKLIHIESIDESAKMEEEKLQEVTFTLSNSKKANDILAANNKVVTSINENQVSLSLPYHDTAEINRLLVEAGCDIYEITVTKKTLEDRFLEITNKEKEVVKS